MSILGPLATRHTTIVRCKFSKFQQEALCRTDVSEIMAQSEEARDMFSSVRAVVHVDNALGSVKVVDSREVLLQVLKECSREQGFAVPDSRVLLDRAKKFVRTDEEDFDQ